MTKGLYGALLLILKGIRVNVFVLRCTPVDIVFTLECGWVQRNNNELKDRKLTFV